MGHLGLDKLKFGLVEKRNKAHLALNNPPKRKATQSIKIMCSVIIDVLNALLKIDF